MSHIHYDVIVIREDGEIQLNYLSLNRPLAIFIEARIKFWMINKPPLFSIIYEIYHSSLFSYVKYAYSHAYQPGAAFGTLEFYENDPVFGHILNNKKYLLNGWNDLLFNEIVFYIRMKYEASAYNYHYVHQVNEKGFGRIIAYSHMRGGRRIQEFDILDDLRGSLETNFGFGQSSFFFLTIRYKGVKLIAFDEWLHYPYANIYQYIQASYVFDIESVMWEKAMRRIAEIGNYKKFNSDNHFCEKYIIKPIQKFLDELERLGEFKYEPDYYDITHMETWKKQWVLIDIKAHKIVESLNVIKEVKSLIEYIDVKDAVDAIVRINKLFKPRLSQTLLEIEKSVIVMKKDYELLNKRKKLLVDVEESAEEYGNILSRLRELQEKLSYSDSLKKKLMKLGEIQDSHFEKVL